MNIGPTCKKMMNLKASDKVFKASAFEPSEEDIRNYNRNPRSGKSGSDSKPKRFAIDIPDDLISDSDDDLPDVAHMLDSKKGKNKRKTQVITSDDDSDVCISDVFIDST
jgi:hypothetical protein